MKHIYIYSLLLSVAVFSCKEKEDFDGPELRLLYGEFGIIESLQSSQDTVDFASGENVYFTAKFKKIVEWKLRLTGLSSGGVKEITGKSSELNPQNSLWKGEVSFLPVFRKEAVAAELFIPGIQDTLKDTLIILNPRHFPEGLVITDFENSNPSFFFDYSVDGDSLYYLTGPVIPAFNNTYFYMSGKDNSGDTYLGQISIEAMDVSTSFVFNTGTANPSHLYFNLAVFGTGVPGSKIDILFKEDDNGDNAYNGSNEDAYKQSIQIDWTGWRMISLPYIAGEFLTYAGAPGTNGNKIFQPDRICEVSFLHMTDIAGSKSSLAIDYPVFTLYQPFKP